MNIVDKISLPGLDKEALAKEVMESPQCLSQLLDGLNNTRKTVAKISLASELITFSLVRRG
jgi:hypothetical protein